MSVTDVLLIFVYSLVGIGSAFATIDKEDSFGVSFAWFYFWFFLWPLGFGFMIAEKLVWGDRE